jgi:hypothetical protein
MFDMSRAKESTVDFSGLLEQRMSTCFLTPRFLFGESQGSNSAPWTHINYLEQVLAGQSQPGQDGLSQFCLEPYSSPDAIRDSVSRGCCHPQSDRKLLPSFRFPDAYVDP